MILFQCIYIINSSQVGLKQIQIYIYINCLSKKHQPQAQTITMEKGLVGHNHNEELSHL